MNNSYDEIKQLLRASNNMLNRNINEDIKKKYGILREQDDINSKINPIKDTEEAIEDEKNPTKDKQQGYRISGGVMTLHGKDKSELELTTDEKVAFQETMDEFIEQVSDLVDFQSLNVYQNDVEWGGKIIDFDIEFYFAIGENNGIYINGDMVKVDENFLDMITKLRTYYEKFKSKWAKVLASRKKTTPNIKNEG
jgi:frataxin-like iron-binding protein CyaY